MIKEWFESVFTRTTPAYRQLGYVYASVALQSRFSRCKNAWNSHIENCHGAILEALGLKKIPKKLGAVLVVGSGPLYEIPYKELLEHTEKLVLLDVVHPRNVQRLARKELKIQLLTHDVTGFATVASDEDKVRRLEFSPPSIDFGGMKFDAVISANILSQLALEPFASAKKKKWKWAGDNYFDKLARKMSADHGVWLKSLGARDTLIFSDIERIYFDKSGQETERAVSACQMPLGLLVKEWNWEIAPLGEVSRNFSYCMRVVCRRL
jgi:hypothetical protein